MGKELNIEIASRIILPAYRKFEKVKHNKAETIDYGILKNYENIITYTPTGQHDDPFLLGFAKSLNGLILSNDQFKDEKFVNDKELCNYYSKKYILNWFSSYNLFLFLFIFKKAN